MKHKNTFQELFEQFQPSLYRYLYRMCGSKETAEELLQETFYRAMISLKLRDLKQARAWLYKVARHLYVDWVRKMSVDQKMREEMTKHTDGISSLGNPEKALEQKAQQRRVEEIMQLLPERMRTILVLREIEDLSYAELAEVLDISMSQVKVMLYRARVKFRQLNGEEEGENE